MGSDIYTKAERRNETGEWECIPDLAPFKNRDYGTFGFLANVRNYYEVSPIAERRGIPDDVSEEVAEYYEDCNSFARSASWLTVSELDAFDYNAIIEDRRFIRKSDVTCDPGEGVMRTYRDFLGKMFFDDLKKLKEAGAERIVFWFDN